MNERAEQIAKHYAYRRLIIQGKVELSRAAAVKLVGPDRAYHLYRRHDGGREAPPSPGGPAPLP